MSAFTAAERAEVDRNFRLLIKALSELDEALPERLRNALSKAESTTVDPTLARVLVAREILRGIAWEGRSPLTVRDYAMPADLASALADAEQLGRAVGPHAAPPRRGLLALLNRRKSFSQAGKEALMRCRTIGAAHERRTSAKRPGRGLKTTA